jgi:hypothetical protein
MRVNGYKKKIRRPPPQKKRKKKKETHLEKDHEKNGWIFAAKLLETLHELL